MTDRDLPEMSDAALVVAIGRWRQDALAEAYRRHAGAVFALAGRVLAERAQAEEVLQDVFLRLWNQPEKFDSERGSLRSFLLTQTHGRAVDLVRSDTARRRREEKDAASSVAAQYDLEDEVHDLVVAEEVREVLAGLPDGERKPIELAYLGGHTYREVASMLGEPEGTIKSRIRSGLRRLRVPLTQAGLVGA